MSVASNSLSPSRSVPTEPIWRFTVDQYHEMVRTGILTDDDPVEFLQGWLVTKMPKNPTHSLATQLTSETLAQRLPDGWHVRAQEPVTMDDSEPEPDVAVVRGNPREYSERHPSPADLGLVVEVSDTTLKRDRGPKRRIYASARIPAYWILDVVGRSVESYSTPSGCANEPDYGTRDVYQEADSIPLVIGGSEVGRIPVRSLLP